MTSRYDLHAAIGRLQSMLAKAERDPELYAAGITSSALYEQAVTTIWDLERHLRADIEKQLEEKS